MVENMKRKIAVTTGTRADYGFLKPILKEILRNKKTSRFKLNIV